MILKAFYHQTKNETMLNRNKDVQKTETWIESPPKTQKKASPIRSHHSSSKILSKIGTGQNDKTT